MRALRLHVRADLAYKEGLCPVPDCRGGAGRLETLTHAFLDCPAAAPVIDWIFFFQERPLQRCSEETAPACASRRTSTKSKSHQNLDGKTECVKRMA